MGRSFQLGAKVRLTRVLSSAVAAWLAFTSVLAAHEVIPTVVTMEHSRGTVTFVVGAGGLGANLEAFVAEVNLSAVSNINSSPQAARYDELRAMSSREFEAAFQAYWPQFAGLITVRSGDEVLPLTLEELEIPDTGNVEFLRPSVVEMTVEMPNGAETLTFDWPAELGALVLRQEGVKNPYDAYLTGGQSSGPIPLDGR